MTAVIHNQGYHFKYHLVLFVVLAFSSLFSFANGKEDKQKNAGDGGFLSLGVGYLNHQSPMRDEVNGGAIFINGRYQWQGLFAEIANGADRDTTLPAMGYNFKNTDNWNFDILAAVSDGSITFKNGETTIITRDKSVGLGLRATGAWHNTSLQLIALPYVNKEADTGGSSQYASAWLSHRWQLRNWSVSGAFGLQYRSAGMMNYLYGVSEEESLDYLPTYEADSGLNIGAQLDISYPITRNWVFRSYIRQTEFDSTALNSPFVQLVKDANNRPDRESEFGISLNYVF